MNDTDTSILTSPRWSAAPAWVDPRPLFSNPIEAILASGLGNAEKREILSSWASDARAVPDAPALRCLDNGAIVGIDDILAALKTLDAASLEARGSKAASSGPVDLPACSRGWIQAVIHGRHSDDDDDDPPPCPAVIAPVPRLPPSGAEVSLEAA